MGCGSRRPEQTPGVTQTRRQPGFHFSGTLFRKTEERLGAQSGENTFTSIQKERDPATSSQLLCATFPGVFYLQVLTAPLWCCFSGAIAFSLGSFSTNWPKVPWSGLQRLDSYKCSNETLIVPSQLGLCRRGLTSLA